MVVIVPCPVSLQTEVVTRLLLQLYPADYYCIDGENQTAILLARPLHGGELTLQESPEELEDIPAPVVEAAVESWHIEETRRKAILRYVYVRCLRVHELCVHTTSTISVSMIVRFPMQDCGPERAVHCS